MRFVAVAVGLLGLAACVDVSTTSDVGMFGGGGSSPSGPVQMDDGMLAYSVGVWSDTNGLYVPEGRQWSVAGMNGLTCQLDMTGGFTQTDLNVGDTDETVVDGDGGQVLVFTSDGTYQVVSFPSGEYGDSWRVEDGVASRLTAEGHVDLAWGEGACTVTWSDGASVDVGPGYCANGAMVVADDGAVWVGARESVARVTPDGVTAFAVPGRELAFDAATGAVVAAGAGSVAALQADGTVAWRVDAGGEIAGFDAAGGFAALSLVGPTPADTEMVLFDVASGEEASRQLVTNVPAGAVNMNEQFVSVTSASQFDFFTF